MIMEQKTQKGLHLGEVAQGFLSFLEATAAAPPWLEMEKTGKCPKAEIPVLDHVAALLAQLHDEAAEEVEERYRKRIDNLKEVFAERRRVLEADSGRERVSFKGEEDTFVLAGRVTDKTTGVGLSYVGVNGKAADLLRGTYTDELGYYRIEFSGADLENLGEEMPEVYIEVLDDKNEPLHKSPKISVGAGRSEYFDAAVEGARVPGSLAMGERMELSLAERLKHFDRRGRQLVSLPVTKRGRAITEEKESSTADEEVP